MTPLTAACLSSSTRPRSMEPLEAQFELLAGLGYRKVEPFGGLFGDPAG